MKQDEARELLDKLGSRQFSVSSQGWLRATCPFAPWLHAKGTDSTPSFAVVTKDSGQSSYKCYSCGVHGSMLTFLHRYERLSGKKLATLHAFVQRTNQKSLDELERSLTGASYGWKSAEAVTTPAGENAAPRAAGDGTQQEMFEPVILPESLLEAFVELPDEQRDYMINKRKLEPLTLTAWGIVWDADKQRIVVPIRDEQFQLVGLSRRSYYDWQKPKYMHSKGFRRDFYLYGEHLLTEDSVEAPVKRVGYLVEGFFDVIKLWQYGYDNVMAIMGSHLSKSQEAKCVKWFDSVVYIPDGDKPGYEAADRIHAQLKKRLRCTVVPMPVGYDPDDLTPAMAKTLLGEPSRC
jgi:DNA primase